MKSIVRWSVGCWIVLAVAFVATAFADDPLAKPKDPIARERLAQGNKHYHVHELEQAIEEYKAGALREDAPVFLYNLGQCYRQLGNYQEAMWHYDRFLARIDPKSDVAIAVQDFMAQMKAELEKRAMSQPPTGPAPEGAKPPQPDPTKPATLATTTVPRPTVPPSTIAVQHDEAWYNDPLGWTATGAGVAGLAVGSYLIVDAHHLSNSANSEPTQSARDALRSKASSRQLVGTISTVGGAAVLAAGVVKLAISRSHSATASSWNISVTTQGVQVFGGF